MKAIYKVVFVFILNHVLIIQIFAQTINQANPFFLGHSLINIDVPTMTHNLAINAGKISAYDYQIINGATLQYQYNNPSGAQGTPYTSAFPTGNHNVFVLTEAVPLQNHITWSNTYQYANSFMSFALANNNNVPFRYYLYETWHCINTGTVGGCDYDNGDSLLWAPRLQSDFSLWAGILNNVRNTYPNNSVNMIPGGQAFYRLNQQIIAGNVPGITNYNQLFTDDIHLTNAGNYFIACVMYACIYKQSPVGLSNAMNNQWGVPYTNMPTASQANIMQQVAWATATELSSWTGVQNTTLPLQFLSIKYDCHTQTLHWTTSNDIHTKTFKIQVSTDGLNWKDEAEISASQSTSSINTYEYEILKKIKFVRVMHVAVNNNSTFSKIITPNCTNDTKTKVYPNPVANYCIIENYASDNCKFEILDKLGRIVQAGNTNEVRTVVNFANLASGKYLIKITDSNQKVETFKIIKL